MRLSNLFKLGDNLQIILRHLVLVDDHYDLQGWLYIVFSLWILKEEWTSLNYWTTILIELKYYISIEINEANHTSIGFFFPIQQSWKHLNIIIGLQLSTFWSSDPREMKYSSQFTMHKWITKDLNSECCCCCCC